MVDRSDYEYRIHCHAIDAVVGAVGAVDGVAPGVGVFAVAVDCRSNWSSRQQGPVIDGRLSQDSLHIVVGHAATVDGRHPHKSCPESGSLERERVFRSCRTAGL